MFTSHDEMVVHVENGEKCFVGGTNSDAYAVLRRFLDTPCAAIEPRNAPSSVQLPGKHRKRVEKSNVSVVVYRRPDRVYSGSHGTGEGRKLDHQIQVSGHYRNQWYSSTKSHKRIFIPEHVKGPETSEPPKIRVIKAVR